MLERDTTPTPLLKEGDRDKLVKKLIFRRNTIQTNEEKVQSEVSAPIILRQRESFDQVEVISTLISKQQEPRIYVKVLWTGQIHKVEKVSYMIQLLLWM